MGISCSHESLVCSLKVLYVQVKHKPEIIVKIKCGQWKRKKNSWWIIV